MRLQRISADHEEVRTDQRDKPRFDSDLSNLLSRLHIGGTPEQQAKFGVPTQFEEVKEHITGLLWKGVIQESSSSLSLPIVLVRKADGSLRLCVDYKRLNFKTKRDAFPLPCIEESLDALGGAQVFSTIDLASGYYQVVNHENDRLKTAFTIPIGLYESRRMPFGRWNAPVGDVRPRSNILQQL